MRPVDLRAVGYVLTAVLPRYTTTGSAITARSTRAQKPPPDPSQPVAPKLRIVRSDPDGDDARMMRHEE